MLKPTQRIIHESFGRGTIEKVLDSGRIVDVRFDKHPRFTIPVRALHVTLLADALKTADPPPPPKTTPQKTTTPTKTTPEKALAASKGTSPALIHVAVSQVSPSDARQSLEALRLGVVPVADVSVLTLGREAERAAVEQLLQSPRGMKVLSGNYGVGKTHMIELAESMALQKKMLVAHASFDPVEVPPSHPLRIYRALMANLKYPDSLGLGLRPLMERLEKPPTHRWLSAAHFAVHSGQEELAEEVLSYVEGRASASGQAQELRRMLQEKGYKGPQLLALPDYRTFGQVMAHLLGGVASWARCAGYGGLLVLLDEAEYFDHLSTTSREMAENVLRYLAAASLPQEELGFSENDLRAGGNNCHQQVNPLYQEDQPLRVICAFTPNPGIDRALDPLFDSPSKMRIGLEAVPSNLIPQLAKRVMELMQRLEPEWQPQRTDLEQIARALRNGMVEGKIENTRQAARAAVEYWDLHRMDPARARRSIVE